MPRKVAALSWKVMGRWRNDMKKFFHKENYLYSGGPGKCFAPGQEGPSLEYRGPGRRWLPHLGFDVC